MKKENRIWICQIIIIMGFVLNLTNNCKRADDELSAVTDKDGNVYKIVTIGTQEWMVENLKTTKYNDGKDIPNVTNNTEWAVLTTPAYCWFDNNETPNKASYGALYNWYTINTGKLCPTGWHVPTDAEWTTLTTFLDGENSAACKLKEQGLAHWISPNLCADNSSGFKALPGGYREYDGTFYYLGYLGYWWTSTDPITWDPWYRVITYYDSCVFRANCPEIGGFSVRCLRNH